jgi:hypothetical protein
MGDDIELAPFTAADVGVDDADLIEVSCFCNQVFFVRNLSVHAQRPTSFSVFIR